MARLVILASVAFIGLSSGAYADGLATGDPLELTAAQLDSVTAGIVFVPPAVVIAAYGAAQFAVLYPVIADDVVSGAVGYYIEKRTDGFVWTGENDKTFVDSSVTGTILRTFIDLPLTALYIGANQWADVLRNVRGGNDPSLNYGSNNDVPDVGGGYWPFPDGTTAGSTPATVPGQSTIPNTTPPSTAAPDTTAGSTPSTIPAPNSNSGSWLIPIQIEQF